MRLIAPLTVITAAVAVLVGAGPARAAAVFGNDLMLIPNNVTTGLTVLQTAPRTDSTTPVAAPVSGVLTKVRIRHGGNTAGTPALFAFRLLSGSYTQTLPLQTNAFTARPATPNGSTVPQLPVPAGAPAGFADWVPKDAAGDSVGVPITNGEHLAVFTSSEVQIMNVAAPGASIALSGGDHTSGSRNYQNGFDPTYEFLMQGTIEADADGDRYGDETQDACPALASTHEPCAVDTTPPQTTITDGPTGTTDDDTPTFEFESSEAGSTFECRVDAQAFAPCSSPHTTASLSEGPHTFDVKAKDPAGNSDESPAQRAFTVDTSTPDTTPPVTTITAGPTGTTDDDTPTFEFGSSEAGSSFECRVDAAAFAPCSSPHTTISLADGRHAFAVRATDPADNVDETPASRTFTVARTRPPGPSLFGGGPDLYRLPPASPKKTPGCLDFSAKASARSLGPVRLGQSRKRHRRLFKGARPSGRGGVDRYCIEGGGGLRIGYPTKRLRRALARSGRRKMRSGALLILTTSKRHSVAGISPGQGTRALARLRGRRSVRVGRSRWTLAAGGASRLVFRSRGGRVVEEGIADKRLTASARAARRLLGAWRL